MSDTAVSNLWLVSPLPRFVNRSFIETQVHTFISALSKLCMLRPTTRSSDSSWGCLQSLEYLPSGLPFTGMFADHCSNLPMFNFIIRAFYVWGIFAVSSFKVLYLGVWSIPNKLLCLVWGRQIGSCSCSPPFEKTFRPKKVPGHLGWKSMTVKVWVYSWIFFSVPLISLSFCQFHTILIAVSL